MDGTDGMETGMDGPVAIATWNRNGWGALCSGLNGTVDGKLIHTTLRRYTDNLDIV